MVEPEAAPRQPVEPAEQPMAEAKKQLPPPPTLNSVSDLAAKLDAGARRRRDEIANRRAIRERERQAFLASSAVAAVVAQKQRELRDKDEKK